MRTRYFYWTLPLLLLVGCEAQHSEADMSSYLSSADSVKLAGDITDINSPSRKYIQTADISCNVPDAAASVLKIEQLVKGMYGIVTESKLENRYESSKDVEYKADSLKRITTYEPVAHMTVRVKNEYLDSLMNSVSSMSVFTTHRTLQQTDATFQYLSNAIKNEQDKALPKPTKQTTEDIVKLQEVNEKQVDRRIDNLRLLDNAEYATLTIELVQPKQVNVQVVVDPVYYSRTAFSTELWTACLNGAKIIRGLTIVCVSLWPMWMLGIAIALMYKYSKKKRVVQKL